MLIRRLLGQGVLDPLDCLAIGTGNCLVLFACTARARLALGTLPAKVTHLSGTEVRQPRKKTSQNEAKKDSSLRFHFEAFLDDFGGHFGG